MSRQVTCSLQDSQPQNTFDMLVAVQKKVKAVPGNKGLGVIYWEPEGPKAEVVTP